MEIAVAQEQGRVPITVFRITGDLGIESYEQLQQQAEAAYDEGTRYLLVDLTDVGFMSSSGLRALTFMFDMLRGDSSEKSDEAVREGIRDGTYKSPLLKLLNPNPNVLRSIETTGFDMFLEIYTDYEEAIASF